MAAVVSIVVGVGVTSVPVVLGVDLAVAMVVVGAAAAVGGFGDAAGSMA
jgi:hypothetical protein